ncbi:MAG: hypothetical protein NC131_10000 [Roseburia sp.]|nr:hypothetical protein [Roseburia sp.]
MKRLLNWINEKWKINWQVPIKWVWLTGADIDGDIIYVGDHKYFFAWGVVHDIGIIDVCRAYLIRHKEKTWLKRYPKF